MTINLSHKNMQFAQIFAQTTTFFAKKCENLGRPKICAILAQLGRDHATTNAMHRNRTFFGFDTWKSDLNSEFPGF